MATPALPPGFQLETQGAAPLQITVHGGANTQPKDLPPLPDGFQLESPNSASGQEPPQPQGLPSFLNAAGDNLSAGFSSGVSALPFGDKALAWLEGQKASLQNNIYGSHLTQQDVAAQDQQQTAANPIASAVGMTAGSIAPYALAAAFGDEVPLATKILGMDSSMPLLARTLASAGSQAAISGADTLERTGDAGQAVRAGLEGGAIGAVAPGAGDLIGKGAGFVGNKVGQFVDTLTNPERAAEKIIGGAARRDASYGGGMTAQDEATAAANGQPVVNVDRYGTNVRQLGRTAANTDAGARQTLDDVTGDRFLTQNQRATDFVRRVTGGNVDDIALQEQISKAARRSNGANYARAESDPAAKYMWSPQIAQLFQSPSFRKAVQDATSTAAEDAAAGGKKAIQNPFAFDANGAPSWRQIAGPDGKVGPIPPNLQFWDIVQRNLREDASRTASRDGMKMKAGQISDVRTKLLEVLDNKVPGYRTARAGAAAAFGADDAIDAGRKFVSQKMGIPEARRAYAKFTPAERKAFATGFASELIDKINSVSDRVNVINNVFGSPAARAQVQLALGQSAADQLEHFLRIEDIMQMTRREVAGNSTTAQQLIASGLIGAGSAGALTGWNPQDMASGALLLTAGRAGARALGKAFDQRVMQRVAQILVSNDPQAMANATKAAAASPAFSGAIQAIEQGLATVVRAGGAQVARQVNGASAPTLAPAPG